MDDPRDKLQKALKDAMRTKDVERRDIIRMALSAIKQVEVDTQHALTAEEVVVALQKEAQKRREAVEELQKAGRPEAADQEQARLSILESFLPKQLSREEIAALAREAITQTGAASPKETGKVMSALMPKVKGLADGKLVNEVVRELLS